MRIIYIQTPCTRSWRVKHFFWVWTDLQTHSSGYQPFSPQKRTFSLKILVAHWSLINSYSTCLPYFQSLYIWKILLDICIILRAWHSERIFCFECRGQNFPGVTTFNNTFLGRLRLCELNPPWSGHIKWIIPFRFENCRHLTLGNMPVNNVKCFVLQDSQRKLNLKSSLSEHTFVRLFYAVS